MSIKTRNGLPNPRKVIAGRSRRPVTGTSRAPRASDSTASTAGMRLTSTTTWKVRRPSSTAADCAAQTTARAMSRPSTAPPVSAAR
jgi:hypothetical protein